jgi:hypothetical protein
MTAGPAREPVRHTDESAGPTATLAEVDIRSELSTRPPRLPDSEGLDRALAVLAREITENPRSMLQKLVETALDPIRASRSDAVGGAAGCADVAHGRRRPAGPAALEPSA